jgi:hypothetical protein
VVVGEGGARGGDVVVVLEAVWVVVVEAAAEVGAVAALVAVPGWFVGGGSGSRCVVVGIDCDLIDLRLQAKQKKET